MASFEISTASNLQSHVVKLFQDAQYEQVVQLFTTHKYLTYIEEIGADLYRAVCLPNLNKNAYDNCLHLYGCAEQLLKIIAEHGSMEEMLLELLELVEECDSEQVFSSALHALQIVLLRLADSKPLAWQWAFNSVHKRLSDLQMPETVYNEQTMALMEQEAAVQTILTHYVTVGLFYTPLLQSCLSSCAHTIFRNNSLTRRNIFCAFFIQLLDRPLALLQLSTCAETPGSNAYTRQITRQLVLCIAACLKADALYLLQFVEQRCRFKRKLDSKKGVLEMSSLNIFTAEEHAPLLGLAVYYYLLFLEFKDTEQLKLPCIYAPLYVNESILYLVNVLLQCKETQLQVCGLKLAKYMLDMLKARSVEIPVSYLEVPLYSQYCQHVIAIIAYTKPVEVRRLALQTLDCYVQQFDEEGRFLLLKYLMSTVTHNSLLGHLAIQYKNLVAKSLQGNVLPASFHSKDFRQVILSNICRLPAGVETDLVDHSNQVISALNTLIYFGMSDKQNLTGFWSFSQEIVDQFLTPLRRALDFSISHYKQEIKQLSEGGSKKLSEEELQLLQMLEVTCEDIEQQGKEIDVAQKIKVLQQHVTTFDLIAHLLGNVTNLFNYKAHNLKNNKFTQMSL